MVDLEQDEKEFGIAATPLTGQKPTDEEDDEGIFVIFADIEYQTDYRLFHENLVAFLGEHFAKVQSGLQGDSWIFIFDGDEKVAIDTFSSMKHQIKSEAAGRHLEKVLEILRLRYVVKVYDIPELEAHEE